MDMRRLVGLNFAKLRKDKGFTQERFAETSGFTQQDVIGKQYEEVFRMEQFCPSLLMDTLQTGKPHIGGELKFPVKSGTLWISTTTSLLCTLTGEVIGAVVVF